VIPCRQEPLESQHPVVQVWAQLGGAGALLAPLSMGV
jgi:hypothetical protein